MATVLNLFIVSNLPCSQERYELLQELIQRFLTSLEPLIEIKLFEQQVYNQLIGDTKEMFDTLK